MIEYKLDQKADKTPREAIIELHEQCQEDYNRLITEGQAYSKLMHKEVRRCKTFRTLLFLRRFAYMSFVFIFIAISLVYFGFATDKNAGGAFWGLLMLATMTSLLVFILAIFRRVYFRTAWILTNILYVSWAVVVALISLIFVKSNWYFIVLLALVFVNILNHIPIATSWTVKGQVISLFISLIAIAFAVICMLGAIVKEENGTHDFYHHNAVYEISTVQGKQCATLSGIMLTVQDVLSIGAKGEYLVADVTENKVQVIEVGEKAFKDAPSINTVVLPKSVSKICAKAFTESEVRIVEVHSSKIYISDCFKGSSVRVVRLLSDQVTMIYIDEESVVSNNITFFVPPKLLDQTREWNPKLANNIMAMR